MELDKAVALMRKLADDGNTHEAIAAELKKKGFKGPRSGKALQPNQIGYYLRKAGESPAEPQPNGIAATSVPSSTVTPEARISMALKVLENADWSSDMRCQIAVTMLKG